MHTDLCVIFKGIRVWVKDMENLLALLEFLKENGIDAEVHKFHYREDSRKFYDEVLTLNEVLEEYEAIGTDFTID